MSIEQLQHTYDVKNKVNEIINEVNIVKQVDTIADLFGLVGSEGQQVSVASYHGLSDLSGGGVFVWGMGRHNGGTFIDPTRPFPTDWNDQAQLAAWFADSGIDVLGLKRVYDGAVNVKWFGASPAHSDNIGAFYAVVTLVNDLSGFTQIEIPAGVYNIGTFTQKILLVIVVGGILSNSDQSASYYLLTVLI